MSVSRAHRRNVVSVKEPRFQEGDLSEELQPMHVKERPRQANLIHVMRHEQPLVRQVVHGEDGFSRTTTRFQIGAGQASMPVMRMHDLGTPHRVHAARQFTADPAQQRKAQIVVNIRKLRLVMVGTAGTIVEARGIN